MMTKDELVEEEFPTDRFRRRILDLLLTSENLKSFNGCFDKESIGYAIAGILATARDNAFIFSAFIEIHKALVRLKSIRYVYVLSEDTACEVLFKGLINIGVLTVENFPQDDFRNYSVRINEHLYPILQRIFETGAFD